MRKIFTLLSFFLFLPLLLIAQSNYKKGFVLTLQGDSLRGYINLQEWVKNPKEIKFKSSPEALEEQTFAPNITQYFEVSGIVAYQHYNGLISMNNIDTKIPVIVSTTVKIDSSKVRDTVFLKVLQKGKYVTFYSYTDNLKTRYFVAETNSVIPQELGFSIYIDSKNRHEFHTINPFKGQLWYLATKFKTDTPTLKREIEDASYLKEWDLLAIVSKVNGITRKEQQLQEKTKEYSRFFAGVGLNRSDMKAFGNLDLVSNQKIIASYLPSVSVGIDGFRNPDVQRLILRGEVFLTMTNPEINNNSDQQKLKQTILGLDPQLIYNFYYKEDLRINVGAGLAYNYAVQTESRYRNRYVDFRTDEPYYIYKDNLHPFKKSWFCLTFRFGVILNKKFDIGAVYFMPADILDDEVVRTSIKTNSMRLQVNYLFNRKTKN